MYKKKYKFPDELKSFVDYWLKKHRPYELNQYCRIVIKRQYKELILRATKCIE